MSETTIVILNCLALALLGLFGTRMMHNVRRLDERALHAALRRRLIRHLASRSDDAVAEASLDGPAFLPVALVLLKQIEGVSRSRLIDVMRRRNAESRLQRQLRHSSRAERLAAAEGLRFFPSSETGKALRRALHDRDADVQLAAAESLFCHDSTPPLDQILSSLARKPASLDIVLRSCGKYHPAAVAAAATAPEAAVRAAVMRALSDRSGARANDTIAQGLRDQSWFVRAAAADAAGRLGIHALIPLMISLVDDEHWWVRFRASEALEKLDAVGRNALHKIAKQGSDRQRRQAALTLTKRVVA